MGFSEFFRNYGENALSIAGLGDVLDHFLYHSMSLSVCIYLLSLSFCLSVFPLYLSLRLCFFLSICMSVSVYVSLSLSGI